MKASLKSLFRTTAFMSLLLVMLLGASHLFLPKDNAHASTVDQLSANGILGEPSDSIDVLIVGDSESYSSFIPMQMWKTHGFTSYVCGTAAQPLYDSYRFMEQAFETQSPSVVVLETNAIFREKHAGSYVSSIIQSKLSLFRNHNRWKSMTVSDLYRPVDYTWTNDYKGYIYINETNPASTLGYMSPTDRMENIPELNYLCLMKMLELCQANNARLILVSTPSTVNWNYARHNTIEAFAQDNDLTYLDMNLNYQEIGINWDKDTRDMGDHLNHRGAEKVSAYFGDYLQSLFTLPDHRDSSDYRSWNDAYQRYSKAVMA